MGYYSSPVASVHADLVAVLRAVLKRDTDRGGARDLVEIVPLCSSTLILYG